MRGICRQQIEEITARFRKHLDAARDTLQRNVEMFALQVEQSSRDPSPVHMQEAEARRSDGKAARREGVSSTDHERGWRAKDALICALTD
jgi:hypothetical protein